MPPQRKIKIYDTSANTVRVTPLNPQKSHFKAGLVSPCNSNHQ